MDNAKVYEIINNMIKKDSQYVDAIDEIIDFGQSNHPSDDWEELRIINHNQIYLDFDYSFKLLIEMIKKNNINGLYFGFTTISLDGTINNCSYLVEVGGTEKCNFNDKNYEWVYDCEWYPSNIEFYSSEFDKIYQIVSKDGGLGNNAEYGIGLAFTVLIINNLIRKYESTLSGKKVGIVAGFHDGDMIKLKGFNE